MTISTQTADGRHRQGKHPFGRRPGQASRRQSGRSREQVCYLFRRSLLLPINFDFFLSLSAATDGPKIRSSYVDTPSDQSFGDYARNLFEIQSFEDWGTLAKTNVASYFFVTMAFVGLLIGSTKGKEGSTASVINITSGAGQIRLSFGYVSHPNKVYEGNDLLFFITNSSRTRVSKQGQLT